MCTMKEYPNLYYRAEELLRSEGINNSMPGYEFIKKGIVVKKVMKNIPISKILREIEDGAVIPLNKNNIKERTSAEQWMVEAIRSIGIDDITIWDYIKRLAQILE